VETEVHVPGIETQTRRPLSNLITQVCSNYTSS